MQLFTLEELHIMYHYDYSTLTTLKHNLVTALSNMEKAESTQHWDMVRIFGSTLEKLDGMTEAQYLDGFADEIRSIGADAEV